MENPYEAPGQELPMSAADSIDAAAAAETKKRATEAMIYGIAGFFCCAPLAVVAIIKGKDVMNTIDATDVGREFRGTAQAGLIMGWVTVALFLVGIFVQIAAVGMAASM